MAEENDKEGLRALVIDDEKEICNIISDCLSMYSCQAETVETCKGGIERFQANPGLYDLVITDLNQKPSGVDVVKAVNASTNPNIPVYIITGGATDELKQKAKELVGEDRHIAKPFPITIFKKIVDDAKQQKYGS